MYEGDGVEKTGNEKLDYESPGEVAHWLSVLTSQS